MVTWFLPYGASPGVDGKKGEINVIYIIISSMLSEREGNGETFFRQ